MPATIQEILRSHRSGHAVVMGVLNVTPDSFSDGGRFFLAKDAIAHAEAMAGDGADIIDVGAESTRPGAIRVGPEEQIARLRQVLPAAVRLGPVISIDATSSIVAGFALDCGAAVINDVSAGREDPQMLPLAAKHGCPVVLMHMLGQPRTMQDTPHYQNVVGEVRDFLAARAEAAVAAGIDRGEVILDPGIGFGKTLEHNLALLARIGAIVELGCPVLVGVSRKRFIGQLTGVEDPADRLSGTIAACLDAWQRGATIFRVHDVAAVKRALAVASAIREAQKSGDCGT